MASSVEEADDYVLSRDYERLMNKFKIGDKVNVVINNDQRYSEDFTGQESEVIDWTGPNWYEIKVQYKDGGYNFLTFNENELEKDC